MGTSAKGPSVPPALSIGNLLQYSVRISSDKPTEHHISNNPNSKAYKAENNSKNKVENHQHIPNEIETTNSKSHGTHSALKNIPNDPAQKTKKLK